MDLSVIIVCYKGWERLTKCLEALDILLILNPDTIVKEEAIGKLLQIAKAHPEYSIISCRQVGENGRERRAAGKFPGMSKHVISKRRPDTSVSFPDWVSGSVMMMRKDTFQNLKGFDESFWMYYEDVDICLRARNAGGEIAFFNDIDIRHDHGGSSRINLKTTAITKSEVQISKHFYIQKHLRGFKRIIYHAFATADNLVTGTITGITGLIFFFVPKLFVRFLILSRLIGYYAGSLHKRLWMSSRSVKFKVADPQ
jgi:GT2 family glycosyltransferase